MVMQLKHKLSPIHCRSDDFREGAKAFIEKRAPNSVANNQAYGKQLYLQLLAMKSSFNNSINSYHGSY
jgi:hypothetical protein